MQILSFLIRYFKMMHICCLMSNEEKWEDGGHLNDLYIKNT